MDLKPLVIEDGKLSLGRIAFWAAFLAGLALVTLAALDRLPEADLVSELLDYLKGLIGLLLGYGGFKKSPWGKGGDHGDR